MIDLKRLIMQLEQLHKARGNLPVRVVLDGKAMPIVALCAVAGQGGTVEIAVTGDGKKPDQIMLAALQAISAWVPSATPDEPGGMSIMDAIDIADRAIADAGFAPREKPTVQATPNSLLDYIAGKPVDEQIRIVRRYISGNEAAGTNAVGQLFNHPRFKAWVALHANAILAAFARRENQMYNVAQDMIINDLLRQSGIDVTADGKNFARREKPLGSGASKAEWLDPTNLDKLRNLK